MKNLTPRDIHPGDYVFVSLYFREDNAQDILMPIKADVVADNYIATKNGAGYTKYAWSEVYPILLTEDHLARLGWTKISPEQHEDYAIFADGKVTVDVVKLDSNNDIAWHGSVYYNDGDAHDANYVHELQDIVYKLSGGTCTPRFNTYIWIAGNVYKKIGYSTDNSDKILESTDNSYDKDSDKYFRAFHASIEAFKKSFWLDLTKKNTQDVE